MFSPYEELEYLAEYLPEEGEMVLITRQSGDLVCKPWNENDLREGINETQLYGFLVQANERLEAAQITPLWLTSVFVVWLLIFLFGVIGLSWSQWFLIPGCLFLAALGCRYWIQKKQQRYFAKAILPLLQNELHNRQIPFYSLIAGIRQHEELRTLLDEIVHWSPQSGNL